MCLVHCVVFSILWCKYVNKRITKIQIQIVYVYTFIILSLSLSLTLYLSLSLSLCLSIYLSISLSVQYRTSIILTLYNSFYVYILECVAHLFTFSIRHHNFALLNHFWCDFFRTRFIMDRRINTQYRSFI